MASSILKTAAPVSRIKDGILKFRNAIPQFHRFHSNSISGSKEDDEDDIYHLVSPPIIDDPPTTNVVFEPRKSTFMAFGTTFKTVGEACVIFDKMLLKKNKGSIIEYNKLLSGISKMNDFVMPIILFKRLNRGTIYTMTTIIKCYDELRYTQRGGFSVLGRALKVGEEPDMATYTTLLNGLIRQGLGGEAALFGRKVLNFQHSKPTMLFYSIYVNALCSISECERALSLLNALEKENKCPNIVMYGNVIDGLCKDLKVDKAIELFKSLDSRGLVPDTATYNSLIRGLCLQYRWDDAELLLSEMRKKNMTDVKTYTIILDGFCKQGMLEDAQKLVKEMEDRGPKPTLVTYNTLIDGFCTLSQIEKAMAIFDRLNSKDLSPNVYTFNTIMAYYCKKRNMNEAMAFFERMVKDGVEPTLITYNTLLYGWFKSENLRKAVLHFNQMIDSDITTCRILLHGLSCLGHLDQAMWVLQAFAFPDIQAYNIMIQGATKRGRQDLASDLLVSMRQRGLMPDTRTLNIRLRSFFENGDPNSAIQVFEDSKEELRDLATYNIFVEGLIRSDHGHLVPKVLQHMEAKNLSFRVPNPPTATILRGLDVLDK